MNEPIRRLALSGLIAAGKDYVADACGFRKASLAEPMYRAARHFFGSCDKSRPDVRRFLQTVGQWGWGCADEAYPFTVERALFVDLMRAKGRQITGMDGPWPEFGSRADFWPEVLLRHLETWDGRVGPAEKVACVNGRFEHELARFRAEGWAHYLVACSPETRRERVGRDLTPAEDGDVSERLARDLFADLPPNRVIWNDHRPAPGPGYLTVDDFKALCEGRRPYLYGKTYGSYCRVDRASFVRDGAAEGGGHFAALLDRLTRLPSARPGTIPAAAAARLDPVEPADLPAPWLDVFAAADAAAGGGPTP